MPRIKVKIPGFLLNQASEKEVSMKVNRLKGIFDFLDKNYGTNVKNKILTDENGKNISVWQVSVNGEIVRDLNAKIETEDEIKIIPFVGGG